MEEMRVYIANLGKYNEGELVGAWFEPPIDFDEVKERIGLDELVEDLPDYIRDNMGALLSYYSSV